MTDIFATVLRDARPFLRQAAVCAAHDLGLFAALETPRDVTDLARAVRAEPRGLRALVRVLALEGCLNIDPCGRVHARFPVPACDPVPREGWGRLAEVLRAGQPLEPFAGPASAAARAAWHRHLGEVGAEPAAELAAWLATEPPHRVLDAGGGGGVYTRAVLTACQQAQAWLVDEPDTLDIAREFLIGQAPRVRFEAADLRRGPLPEGCDLGLLVHVLHLHGAEECAAIVRTCVQALQPGGRLVVLDLALDPDRRGPALAAYFALDMALYTQAGEVWTETELRGWMATAGLTAIARLQLAGAPGSCALVGRRG